ncbi:MAG: lipopolysaccharide heptosyltransferase II [Candidatus Aminicenantes bacterium]|nr:lipopolysaccharide heptosyltransferase II [Candidatus Aminicenantes bacterium]NIM83762.1 lipopolysaccharide heptosyltransferase II [Candidatus Aminicenantes bacterium]NIN23222.1 lipopolysaccharide heptosyltransferase II [Candidatus Aminicenantes bacterium]NIN46916.1 lipopolysaccharide heptosyltransferase II [Candidatus Aminicenantes bacterium]NIN89838.1 lipopolysaccharide heptosyltransferase II [Candidatus Aminicenantes bacterium]
MALPAIRALKNNFPDANLYLAAKQYLGDLFENIDEIKKMITIPDTINLTNTFKAAAILRKYRFDWGVLFTNSFSSAVLFKLGGIKRLVGYVRDLRGFLLKKKLKFPRDEKHHIYFYLNLARALPGEKTGQKQEIPPVDSNRLVITGEERDNAASVLFSLGIDLSNKTVIGISPSAAYGSSKAWLPGRFSALIKRFLQEKPSPIYEPVLLLFGSAKEREEISRIAEAAARERDGNVYNLAGQLSLRQAIVAISFCHLFVSNDSGLMHIASSLDIPLIALFGPTQPHKTGPLNEKTKVIHYPEACECAPCLHRECPLDHPCMKAITVDEVFETMVSLLSSSPSSSTSTLTLTSTFS